MKSCFQLVIKKLAGFSSGEAGTSLVEALVAIAILGVSATAFLLALSTGSIATRSQDEEAMAQGLVRTQIEAIKAAAYDATGASYAIISTPSEYGISLSTSSSLYGSSAIQKVTVAVSHAGTAVLTLEGYKADR
jgi:type II secretory pathway pseudopilin PulG